MFGQWPEVDMSRLVYYSLALPQSHPRPDLVWQIEASVRSLRAYNRTVPVFLFAYGDLPPELAARLTGYGVTIHPQGSYEERLARLAPRGWEALSRYPLLHKFLNFPEIGRLAPRQVLFLDCDTLFFDDVDRLFARYADADLYAREEPTCRRSHYGYDPEYLDEDLLSRLASSQGVSTPPPFNLGVVLINNGLSSRLAQLGSVLVSYAWRLAVWMALYPPQGKAASYGEGEAIRFLRESLGRLAGPEDVRQALPYPSGNRWILDQVALWLTLGHLPGLRYGDFSTGDVLQNGELLSRRMEECDWALCHYFSQNMERVDGWIRDYLARAPGPAAPPQRQEDSRWTAASGALSARAGSAGNAHQPRRKEQTSGRNEKAGP
jgi:hypothetical protein